MFLAANFTYKLTRPASVTKLFCEHGQERVNIFLPSATHKKLDLHGSTIVNLSVKLAHQKSHTVHH